MECLAARISYLNKKIEIENDTLSNKINVIRNNSDLQNFLTRVENTLVGKDLDLSHCSVEFSDTIKNNVSSVNQVKDILKQASSMASSYSYVARQADKGSKANQQFQNMKENGLDIANTMIKSSDNLDFVWNKYGFKGREWDDVKNEFAPEQLAMTNNLLAFTKDSWEHTCAAIGKISYFDDVDQTYKWDYGINAGVLIGDLVMSEQLRIMNDSGNYYIDKNGFTMVKKDSNGKVLSEIAIKPENPSMVLSRNGKSLFDFNSAGKGCLRIGSDTSGITFDQSGNATFAGKISSSSGDIGSWHIDGNGFYGEENKSSFLTAYGNLTDKDFNLDGISFQSTFYNGKLICGVASDSASLTLPDTSHGYTDMSARGFFSKSKGMADNEWLLRIDTEAKRFITDVNITAPNIGDVCISSISKVSFNSPNVKQNLESETWTDYDYSMLKDITDIMVIPVTQSYGIVTSESHSNGKLTLTMTNISGEAHTLGCVVYLVGYKKISSSS